MNAHSGINDFSPISDEGQASKKYSLTKSVASKVLKSLVGAGLIAAIGWFPLTRVLQVSSSEAVINARFVVLRAPIQGVVRGVTDHIAIGQIVHNGDVPVTVVNDRAERGALLSTERELSLLRSDLETLTKQRDNYTNMRDTLSAKFDDFVNNRTKVLELQHDANVAKLESANIHLNTTLKAKQRIDALAAKEIVRMFEVEEQVYQLARATENVAASNAQLETTKAELLALKQKSFIGDGYNDIPRTLQRVDDIDMSLMSMSSEIEKVTTRISMMEKILEKEQADYKLRSEAQITAPRTGQIWDLLTTTGETVNQGQDIMKILDCSNLIVTSKVDESTFNRLNMGMPVVFHPSRSRGKYTGEIIQLSGLSASFSNLAIQPDSLKSTDYLVMASINGGLSSELCPVGKTGRLVFAGI